MDTDEIASCGRCVPPPGTGAALALGRAPGWARVVAGVVAPVVAFWLLNLLDVAIKSVYVSESWFRDEVALVVAGVVLAAIGLRLADVGRRQHA